MPRPIASLALALAGWLTLGSPVIAQENHVPIPVSLTAERGDLVLTLSDHRQLRGADLIGATLDMAGIPIRIAGALPDPEDHRHEVWLFDLRQPDGEPFCSAAPDGTRLAMTLPDAESPLGFGLTCTSGAAGKCIRFGYAPWRLSPDGEVPLAPYHAACVNMVRAAYGGPEHAFTRNGMRIDLYDRIGIQQPANEPGQAFEAGWTPAGAVCVAHPRVPENGSLAEIEAAVPGLASHTGPAICTEAEALRLGALVFNRSAPPG